MTSVTATAERGLDARARRTRTSLREAALTLAAEAPIETITVADLARAAGINRATFYKHADSPLQLLGGALIDDLDAIRGRFLIDAAAPTVDFTALWTRAAHLTVAHVERFEAVYRCDFGPDAHGSLQAVLSRHIAHSMQQLFAERPDLLPEHDAREEAFLINALAAFLGHGLMGILHRWFHSEPRDTVAYTHAVLAALPAWMLPASRTP